MIIMLNNIGTSCAYLIIFLDSSEKFLKEGLELGPDSILLNKALRLGFVTLFIFPFLFARTTKALQWASGVAVTCIMSFVAVSVF